MDPKGFIKKHLVAILVLLLLSYILYNEKDKRRIKEHQTNSVLGDGDMKTAIENMGLVAQKLVKGESFVLPGGKIEVDELKVKKLIPGQDLKSGWKGIDIPGSNIVWRLNGDKGIAFHQGTSDTNQEPWITSYKKINGSSRDYASGVWMFPHDILARKPMTLVVGGIADIKWLHRCAYFCII